jgi:hypothetical protein
LSVFHDREHEHQQGPDDGREFDGGRPALALAERLELGHQFVSTTALVVNVCEGMMPLAPNNEAYCEVATIETNFPAMPPPAQVAPQVIALPQTMFAPEPVGQ